MEGVKGAYSKLEFLAPHFLHGDLCPLGILAVVHLDEGMALILVDDAGLHLAKTVENIAELGFGAATDCQLAVSIVRAGSYTSCRELTLHRPQKGSGCTP